MKFQLLEDARVVMRNYGSLLTVFYAIEDESGPCVMMQTRWTLEE